MRISDWSSDVCSSDLEERHHARRPGFRAGAFGRLAMDCAVFLYFHRYGNTDTWPAGGQLQPYLWLHRHAQLWPCGIFRRWVLRDGHAAAIDAMAIDRNSVV